MPFESTKRELDKFRSRVYLKKSRYGGGCRSIIDHLGFTYFILKQLWSLQPSIVVSCDMDTLLPALIYCRVRKCLLIFDQFDPISSRFGSTKFSKLLMFAEMTFCTFANVCISASLSRIPRICRRRWIEMPNVFEPTVPIVSKKENQILYAGVLQHDRNLKVFLEASSFFPEITFKIAGFGPLESEIQKFCENRSNCIFLGQISHTEVMSETGKSKAIWAFYDPCISNNRRTASNKLSEACLVNTPIITNFGTDLGDIIEANDLGIACEYGKLDSAVQAIREVSLGSTMHFNTVFARTYIQNGLDTGKLDLVYSQFLAERGS